MIWGLGFIAFVSAVFMRFQACSTIRYLDSANAKKSAEDLLERGYTAIPALISWQYRTANTVLFISNFLFVAIGSYIAVQLQHLV